MGRCPECGEWNTFTEEVRDKRGVSVEVKASRTFSLSEIEEGESERLKTGIEEFDRVLGGGLVPGVQVLLGGDPGIGKSTLMLQVADALGRISGKVLYVTGEESLSQVKLRASRLGIKGEGLNFVADVEIDRIIKTILDVKPKTVVFDSLQTFFTPDIPTLPGTISQMKEVTQRIVRLGKEGGIVSLMLAHVTKEGIIAGPRLVEHLVDVVLYLEGERNTSLRVLRSVKNRFGPTKEVGVFDMREEGLVEVKNPSSFFLDDSGVVSPGSVIYPHIEGSRVFLLEIQALTSYTPFGTPRRIVTGIDYQRFSIILAVIEKKFKVDLRSMDVFANVAGGFVVRSPSADLPLALAVISSLKDRTVPRDVVVFGEVGLGGEVRKVPEAEKRLKEAERMEFKLAIVPYGCNRKDVNIKVKEVKDVKEAVDFLFG